MASMYVPIKKAFERLRNFYQTEARRAYKSWEGHTSFLPKLGRSTPELTSGKVVALVVLGPLSPALWGAIFAVIAHNVRMSAEWIKGMVNGLYEDGREPITTHKYIKEARSFKVLRNILSLPGTIIGLVLGAVISTVLANIAAIAYTAVGMGSLALNGEFAHGAYNDNLNPVARHVLGLPGSMVGFAIGMVPFAIISLARILGHSALTFARAVSLPKEVLDIIWEEKPHNIINRSINMSALLQKGRRHPAEVYGLGFPGLVLGLIVGAIPALFIVVVGSIIKFPQAFKLAFRDVYNTVADRELDYDVTELTLLQRFTFGLLGTLMGSTLAATITSGVALLRITTNSARLFASTAAGIINLTFAKPDTGPADWFGFNKKNIERQSRWGFGIPGIILALGLVGIPCAAFTLVKNAVFILAMAVSLVFTTPVRVIRQTLRYLTNDMVFSPKNKRAPQAVEALMQRYMAHAIDANGELVAGVVPRLSQKELEKPYFTFGFLKNLLKLLRKSIQFDMRSEMEDVLNAILTELRAVTRDDKNNINMGHFVAVTKAVRKAQEEEKSDRIHNRYEIKQICTQMEALGFALISELAAFGGVTLNEYNRFIERPLRMPRGRPVSVSPMSGLEEREAPVQAQFQDVVLGIQVPTVPQFSWQDIFFAARPVEGVIVQQDAAYGSATYETPVRS